MSKLKQNLRDAIVDSGLKDGMTISFHHHLRNGDRVVNLVLSEIAAMGFKDIRLNVSALMDVQLPLIDYIKAGVITGIETSYMSAAIGREISKGILPAPVLFKTHGGRASDIVNGISKVDVAFIAASACDRNGNCSGRIGQAAFGGIGYSSADAEHAAYKVCVTDNLLDGELEYKSIPGERIDSIVCVDSIGDTAGIVSTTTQITRSPTRLKNAKDTVKLMLAAGVVKENMNFQTGSGGISLAVSKYLHEYMLQNGIHGGSCIGGITGMQCDMLRDGTFQSIYDVQCFDAQAVKSLNEDAAHYEITAEEYASPTYASHVNRLDAVILGATEIDTDFNVNVHTDSFGSIMGGSGGHSDAAEGSALTVIVAPLFRGRLCLVRDRVTTISTPGKFVDVLVTEYGVAVNPQRKELASALQSSGLKIMEIQELYETGLRLAGKPMPLPLGKREIASVVFRDGKIIDRIYERM